MIGLVPSSLEFLMGGRITKRFDLFYLKTKSTEILFHAPLIPPFNDTLAPNQNIEKIVSRLRVHLGNLKQFCFWFYMLESTQLQE